MTGTVRSLLRCDPVVPIIGVVALAVYLLHGFQGVLSRDLGVYSYAGQRVLDGELPYEGIVNRAGPLAHLLPAVGAAPARLLGVDDLLGMRLFFLLIAVGCVCVTYLLGRDLFSSRAAGIATAGALLTFQGFIEYASNGPREKTPMELFFVLSLLALVHRRWLAAGVWLGLATFTLQLVLPAGVIAFAIALLAVPRSSWLRAVVRYAAGGLIPLAVFVVWYAAAGEFETFYEGFVGLNLTYTQPDPFLGHAAARWALLERGYGWSLWVLVAGSVALLGLSVCALIPGFRRRHPEAVMVAACGAGLVVSLVWVAREFDGWPDAFPLLPFAAVGVGGLVSLLRRWIVVPAVIAVVMVWTLVAVGTATAFSVGERTHELDLQQASVRAVFDRLPADATAISIDGQPVMVLGELVNPSRYQVFTGGMDEYIDDSWPGGLRGYAAWMTEQDPTVIATSSRRPRWWLRPVLRDYQLVGRAPAMTLYVDRSVPEATRQQIHLDLLRLRER